MRIAIAAALAVPLPATAQPSPSSATSTSTSPSSSGQAVTATAQFDRGRALLKEKRYAEACAAFEHSQKLDPQWGTLYNLANCYAKAGKLASAWAAYRELAQRDTKPARRKDAAKQARALDKRLPRLLLVAPAAPAGLAVTLDGVDVTALIGADNPVDLGSHAIHATAPGRADLDTTATIADEGRTVTLAIELAPARPERPAARAPATPVPDEPGPAAAPSGARAASPRSRAPAAGGPGEAESSEPGRAASSRRRTYGVIVAAGGGALLATGLVFGRLASSKWSEARALCGDDLMCDSDADLARGNRLVGDARSQANLSTALVIGGAAAIGVGAILWLTAPRGEAPRATALRIAPAVGPGAVSLTLDGRF